MLPLLLEMGRGGLLGLGIAPLCALLAAKMLLLLCAATVKVRRGRRGGIISATRMRRGHTRGNSGPLCPSVPLPLSASAPSSLLLLRRLLIRPRGRCVLRCLRALPLLLLLLLGVALLCGRLLEAGVLSCTAAEDSARKGGAVGLISPLLLGVRRRGAAGGLLIGLLLLVRLLLERLRGLLLVVPLRVGSLLLRMLDEWRLLLLVPPVLGRRLEGAIGGWLLLLLMWLIMGSGAVLLLLLHELLLLSRDCFLPLPKEFVLLHVLSLEALPLLALLLRVSVLGQDGGGGLGVELVVAVERAEGRRRRRCGLILDENDPNSLGWIAVVAVGDKGDLPIGREHRLHGRQRHLAGNVSDVQAVRDRRRLPAVELGAGDSETECHCAVGPNFNVQIGIVSVVARSISICGGARSRGRGGKRSAERVR